MCMVIMWNILRPSDISFDRCVWLNMVCTSFIPPKRRDYNLPTHKMSLKSGAESPVNFIGKIVIFSQLRILHGSVHFGVLDNPAGVILVGTSSIYKSLSKELPRWNHELSLFGTAQSPIPCNDAALVTPNCSKGWFGNKENLNAHPDSQYRTVLFGATKCIAILWEMETSVPFTRSSTRPTYMAPYTNAIIIHMVLPASKIVFTFAITNTDH